MTTLPSVITITLTGASHLVGFSTFSAQEVRRVRFDRPGHRVLVGPFHRQPEPGVPLPIRLKPSTRAIYIRARAYDRDHDLHAALTHAPGDRVELPLLAPPPISDASVVSLARLFRAAEWTEAITYRDTFPHEYSRRASWADQRDFVWTCEMIARHGYRNWFNRGWWTQLDIDGFTHWTGWQPPHTHLWINRRPLDRPAVPHRVRQVLVAEDARLLEVPDARALALALFPEAGR